MNRFYTLFKKLQFFSPFKKAQNETFGNSVIKFLKSSNNEIGKNRRNLTVCTVHSKYEKGIEHAINEYIGTFDPIIKIIY